MERKERKKREKEEEVYAVSVKVSDFIGLVFQQELLRDLINGNDKVLLHFVCHFSCLFASQDILSALCANAFDQIVNGVFDKILIFSLLNE